MEAPSPSYIITRALFVIGLIVAVLSGVSFYKKKQRQAAIIADLKSISSDSSFFQQFYAADVELASAKRLASDLADAHVIESTVRDRILKGLSPATP